MATKNPTPKTKQQTQTEKHWTSSLIYDLYSSFAFYTNCIVKKQKIIKSPKWIHLKDKWSSEVSALSSINILHGLVWDGIFSGWLGAAQRRFSEFCCSAHFCSDPAVRTNWMWSLLEQNIEDVPGLQKGHKGFQGSPPTAGLQRLLWKYNHPASSRTTHSQQKINPISHKTSLLLWVFWPFHSEGHTKSLYD